MLTRKLDVSLLVGFATAVALAAPLNAQVGNLRVLVSTMGADLDPDGYVVALDTLRQPVGTNGSALFLRFTTGSHTAILLDVSEDCSVEDNPRKVFIADGSTAEIRFQVVCSVLGAPSTPGGPQAVAVPTVANAEPVATGELPDSRVSLPLDPVPIGYFAAGYWIGTLEPPGFSSYPVRWTFYSRQELGEVVGDAYYESPSPCSYDLILEFVGTTELVVAQQLVTGDCANGTRVVLRREEEKLVAYWLRADKSPWFEAELTRVSPNRP